MIQGHISISSSSDHDNFRQLLKRREFGRFSDSRFKGRSGLNDVLQELAAPALSYKVKRIECIEAGTVHLEGGICFKSPILAKVLEHCDTLILFIATIGSALEEEAARLNEDKRLTRAYVLDRLGSLTAEHVVNAFHENMKHRYAQKGYGVTLRFSPGYCDWPITEQRKLMRLVDAETIGVTMKASCLMHPRKSVSGVFGLFPQAVNGKKPVYHPCGHCGKKDCNARRHCVA